MVYQAKETPVGESFGGIMSVCLVLAHPDTTSLSAQIFHELAAVLDSGGFEVFRQDLYRDEFNPVLPLDEIKRRMSLDPLVARYSTQLSSCDRILIIHPDWWSGPPAILKGWVDRLFRPGTAYDEIRDFLGDDAEFVPLLEGKKVDVVVQSYQDVSSQSFYKFWKQDVFGWCGVECFTLYHLNNLRSRDESEIVDWKRSILKKIVEL